MTDKEIIQEAVTHFTKKLVDDGKLIEAGFVAFRKFVMSPKAPPIQVSEMQLAFMAGADHLFSCIMTFLDPDSEPTETDLDRMDKLSEELKRWRGQIKLRAEKSQGTG
jgi:hypothetical protein